MTSSRVRGRTVALSLLALIVIAVATALGFWFRGREPDGPIRALTAASDDSVVLLREGYRQHDFVHLTYRTLGGEQRWSVPFHDVPRTARPVVVGGKVVCWVRNHLGKLELHAFDLQTGQFAYRAAATDVPAGVTPSVDILVIDGTVIASASTGTGRVHILDGESGRVSATHELGQGTLAPRLTRVGPTVEISTGDGVDRRVDLRSGSVYVLPPGFSTSRDLAPPIDLREGVGCAPGLRRCIGASLEGRALPVVAADHRGNLLFAAAGTSFGAVDTVSGRVLGHDGPAAFQAVAALPPAVVPVRQVQLPPDAGRPSQLPRVPMRAPMR